MRVWKLLLGLTLCCTIAACANKDGYSLTQDVPTLVAVIANDKSQATEVPSIITDNIRSLKFKDLSSVEKPLGFPPAHKIKTFNVAAYAEYKDGWLIASGRGEWGGVVFWMDKEGYFEVIHDDDLAYPIDLISDGNTLFLLQGMSHLTLADGHLLEITRKNGKFATKAYPINLYPSGFEQMGERWIIPIGSNNDYFLLSELQAGNPRLHPSK